LGAAPPRIQEKLEVVAGIFMGFFSQKKKNNNLI